MLYQAFDETWEQLAEDYQTQAIIEDPRKQLASIIVALAETTARVTWPDQRGRGACNDAA
jgi:hypothetical protein